MRQIHSGHRFNYAKVRLPGLLAMLWLAVVIPFSASAQMVPSSAAESTSVEIPENLTRDQVRELIITQLDKLALQQDQTADPAVYMGQLREGIRVAGGAGNSPRCTTTWSACLTAIR